MQDQQGGRLDELISCAGIIVIYKLRCDGLQIVEFHLKKIKSKPHIASTWQELNEDEKNKQLSWSLLFHYRPSVPAFLFPATPWLSLGEIAKIQTTTSLECNEKEDKQAEGMWQRYSSMRNVDEPKFNWERAQCFNRQGHHVGACHNHVPRFGWNHYAEIFDKTDMFCRHHTKQ